MNPVKEKIINCVMNLLNEDRRILFAYVYGSFVQQEQFRDIDIAIYINNSEKNPFVITSDLKEKLSRKLKKDGFNFIADDFDVRVVNDAPFTFLNRVIKEGILLLDRSPSLKTDLIEYISKKYRECSGLLREAA
jgi:predicted nucleotidyltransferase